MPTIQGTVKDSSGNFARRLVRAHRRDSGAVAAETLSNPSTGAFSLTVADASRHYIVVHDSDAWITYLPLNGANNSTVFEEWGGVPVTAFGTTKISTARPEFGGSAVFFDGGGAGATNNRLVLGPSPSLSLTGLYSVEIRVYPTAIRAVNQLLFTPAATGPVRMDIEANTGKVTILGSSDNASWLFTSGFVSSNALTLNAWNHIELTDDGTTCRLFIEGVLAASRATWARTTYNGAYLLGGSDAVDRTLAGYLVDYKVSKGVARHTANFTPSATPYSASMQRANALIYDHLTPV